MADIVEKLEFVLNLDGQEKAISAMSSLDEAASAIQKTLLEAAAAWKSLSDAISSSNLVGGVASLAKAAEGAATSIRAASDPSGMASMASSMGEAAKAAEGVKEALLSAKDAMAKEKLVFEAELAGMDKIDASIAKVQKTASDGMKKWGSDAEAVAAIQKKADAEVSSLRMKRMADEAKAAEKEAKAAAKALTDELKAAAAREKMLFEAEIAGMDKIEADIARMIQKQRSELEKWGGDLEVRMALEGKHAVEMANLVQKKQDLQTAASEKALAEIKAQEDAAKAAALAAMPPDTPERRQLLFEAKISGLSEIEQKIARAAAARDADLAKWAGDAEALRAVEAQHATKMKALTDEKAAAEQAQIDEMISKTSTLGGAMAKVGPPMLANLVMANTHLGRIAGGFEAISSGRVGVGVEAIGRGMKGIADAAIKAAKAIFQFAEAGEEANRIERAFGRLGGDGGVMDQLRQASAGLKDDTSLQQFYNEWSQKGMAVEEIVLALNLGIGKLEAEGGDALAHSGAIMKAVMMENSKGLAKAGIDVGNINALYQEYAASIGKTADALSEAEKSQALMAKVQEKGAGLMQSFEAAQKNVIGQTRATFENALSTLQQSVGTMLSESGILGAVTNGLGVLMGFFEQIQPVLQSLFDAADRIMGALTPILDLFVGQLLDLVIPILDVLMEALDVVLDVFDMLAPPIMQVARVVGGVFRAALEIAMPIVKIIMQMIKVLLVDLPFLSVALELVGWAFESLADLIGIIVGGIRDVTRGMEDLGLIASKSAFQAGGFTDALLGMTDAIGGVGEASGSASRDMDGLRRSAREAEGEVAVAAAGMEASSSRVISSFRGVGRELVAASMAGQTSYREGAQLLQDAQADATLMLSGILREWQADIYSAEIAVMGLYDEVLAQARGLGGSVQDQAKNAQILGATWMVALQRAGIEMDRVNELMAEGVEENAAMRRATEELGTNFSRDLGPTARANISALYEEFSRLRPEILETSALTYEFSSAIERLLMAPDQSKPAAKPKSAGPTGGEKIIFEASLIGLSEIEAQIARVQADYAEDRRKWRGNNAVLAALDIQNAHALAELQKKASEESQKRAEEEASLRLQLQQQIANSMMAQISAVGVGWADMSKMAAQSQANALQKAIKDAGLQELLMIKVELDETSIKRAGSALRGWIGGLSDIPGFISGVAALVVDEVASRIVEPTISTWDSMKLWVAENLDGPMLDVVGPYVQGANQQIQEMSATWGQFKNSTEYELNEVGESVDWAFQGIAASISAASQAIEANESALGVGLAVGKAMTMAFVDDLATRSWIMMAFSFAEAARDFATFNYLGGALHTAAGIKYGIVAAMGTKKKAGAAAQKPVRPAATATADRDRGPRESAPKRQTQVNQNFFFSSLDQRSPSRIVADALNAGARSGVRLDGQLLDENGFVTGGF